MIVVATETAPASHDSGAGIAVPAPLAQAESTTPWAIATGLANAPVGPEGVTRKRITSAGTRQPAKRRGDVARHRWYGPTDAVCVTAAAARGRVQYLPVDGYFLRRYEGQ